MATPVVLTREGRSTDILTGLAIIFIITYYYAYYCYDYFYNYFPTIPHSYKVVFDIVYGFS